MLLARINYEFGGGEGGDSYDVYLDFMRTLRDDETFVHA